MIKSICFELQDNEKIIAIRNKDEKEKRLKIKDIIPLFEKKALSEIDTESVVRAAEVYTMEMTNAINSNTTLDDLQKKNYKLNLMSKETQTKIIKSVKDKMINTRSRKMAEAFMDNTFNKVISLVKEL